MTATVVIFKRLVKRTSAKQLIMVFKRIIGYPETVSNSSVIYLVYIVASQLENSK